MNIIYINHYSGSQIEPREWRPYYLSKSFVDKKVNSSVICASYHHLQKKTSTQKESVQQEVVDGVSFNWLKTPYYIGNGIGRIKNMLYFGWQVFKIDPVKDLNLDIPDLIIASSAHPFHLLGALRWSRKYNAKIFFEVRDIWPLSLNLMVGLSKLHPLSIILNVFQYIGLKYTDKTIGLGQNMESYFLEHGLDNNKFLYICNGIDENQPISRESNHDDTLKLLREQYSRIIMYTGSHGAPNALNILIETMNNINDDNIALVLIGNGDLKSELIKSAKNKNVIFLNSVPKDQVQRVLQFSDICIISWQDLELYKFGVSPNKVFDYMFAKKPIIQSLDSPNNQVEESGCGLNITPGNISEMEKAILSLCSKSDDELVCLGEKGYRYVLENFSYKKLASKILDEIN